MWQHNDKPMRNIHKVAANLKSVPGAFLGVMVLLVLALGWLGWLLLDQDHLLKEQRIREIVDSAAAELEGAVANEISTKRENLNEIVAILSNTPGRDLKKVGDVLRARTTYVHFSMIGITVIPDTDLRYLPMSRISASLPPKFEHADRLEFQQHDYAAAKNLLKPLAESTDANIQAAALMRLGRIEKRNGHTSEALNSYRVLSGLSGQKIGSVPADWLGFYASCVIYEADNKILELGVELSRLVHALTAGGYEVSTATYGFYVDAAVRWAGITGKADVVRGLAKPHAASELAAEFFEKWSTWRQGAAASSGIQIGGIDSGQLLGIWTTFESDLLVAIFRSDELYRTSLGAVTDNLKSRGIGWRISDATGQNLLSSSPNSDSNATSMRSLVIGDMPFTIATFSMPNLVSDSDGINRRQLLLTGLLVILLIILVSTYSIFQSLQRKAEVSRLQSDFVAAVSHEFRTPLTAIRQLTELLASGRVESKHKIATYYRVLEKESARLQRLVEGLLDYARMEAGAHPYRPEQLDCGALLESIAVSFREEYDLTAASLSLEIKGRLPVWTDKEALIRAVWNLLDNAVKYSPESVTIEITAQLENDKVSISVSDRGVGMSADEHSEIFNKFARGSAAGLTNAKGTGMGLAMVRKIIEDQGGSVNAHNNPHGGSVFTIVLASEKLQ